MLSSSPLVSWLTLAALVLSLLISSANTSHRHTRCEEGGYSFRCSRLTELDSIGI